MRQGNKQQGNHVPDLTSVSVSSVEQIDQLLLKATKNRSTNATDMNEHSSRSHLLMMLEVEGTDTLTGTVSRGDGARPDADLNPTLTLFER